MSKPSKPDYVVGYGRPPAASQFKRGSSGNPKGRPKGSQNLNALLHDVFNEKVEIIDARGRKRKISKIEAAATQLVNRAVKGDHRAIKEVLGMAPLLEHARVTEKGSADDARRVFLAKLLAIRDRISDKPV